MDAIPTIVCETLYSMGLHDQVLNFLSNLFYKVDNTSTLLKKCLSSKRSPCFRLRRERFYFGRR